MKLVSLVAIATVKYQEGDVSYPHQYQFRIPTSDDLDSQYEEAGAKVGEWGIKMDQENLPQIKIVEEEDLKGQEYLRITRTTADLEGVEKMEFQPYE